MAYTAKEYQGGAAATTLSADITSGATTFSAVSASAYPTGSGGNFVIVLDRGKSTEEKILCSSRTSNAFTVATSGRGYDGTTAVAHSAGAALEHVLTATDLSEANTAVVNTVGRVTALGDLLVGSGPNALSKLAIGTAGQVLTVSGGTIAWGTGAAPSGAAGGDLTGTYPNPTLGATGPGATGPIGSTTVTPVITIDAKGRVTALSSAVIAASPLPAWTAYTPTMSGTFTPGNGVATGRYLISGKMMWIRVDFTLGSTSSMTNTSTVIWSLPSGTVVNAGPDCYAPVLIDVSPPLANGGAPVGVAIAQRNTSALKSIPGYAAVNGYVLSVNMVIELA